MTNAYNLKQAPWTDAIGIEEDDDSVQVPSIVCWFTRGWDENYHPAQTVVDLHNLAEKRR